MNEIGAMLRAAREERGLSLDEIQSVTKIRYKHLQALEAGDFGQIPGEVYVKGFLVNFAKNVGLDGDQILQKYYTAKKKQERPAGEDNMTLAEGSFGALTTAEAPEKVPVKRPAPKKSTFLIFGVIGFLLLMVIVLGVLLPTASTPGSMDRLQQDAPTMTEDETPQTVATRPTREEQTVFSMDEPESLLSVQASEVVWVGVYGRVSEQVIFEGTLYPGERQEWVLTEEVALRIGNAGGLQVNYGGEDLGLLGYSGQVITKVITVD